MSDSAFKVIKNLPRPEFLGYLDRCLALVGNSSSGIIEASYLGVPVVNIGTRQEGRERGMNVIDAPHSIAKIKMAIRRAISPEFKQIAETGKCPYGDGHSAARMIEVLKTIDPTDIQKKLTY
jgi:UDP-N-acetylglucosamine 2-epimerase